MSATEDQNFNQDIPIYTGELITTAFPLQTTNKEIKQFSIDLAQGQSISQAILIVSITLPNTGGFGLLGLEPSATVYLNGNIITRFVWGNGEPDTQTLQQAVTNLKANSDNSLEIDVDGAFLNAGFKVSADVVYELNTPQGPTNNPGSTIQNQNPNPPLIPGLPSLPSWQQIKPYAIVGGVILGAIIILPPLFSAIVPRAAAKCKGPLCALVA